MQEPAPRALTIDELARETGLTVRNVRAYRSRGLLPEPELRGRKGYYGEEHIARLRLVRDLRAQGFNLEAIARIVERAPGDSATDALQFMRALHAPLSKDEPRVVSAAVFVERWGDQLTPELARRAQRLGFVRQVGEDQFEVRSPRLEQASIELRDLGIPLEQVIEIGALLQRNARAVSRAYIDLFNEHVWEPFEREGEPAADWPKVREALDRMLPLAGESLLAAFQHVFTETVGKELEERLAAPAEPVSAAAGAARPSARKRPAPRSRARGGRRSGAARR